MPTYDVSVEGKSTRIQLTRTGQTAFTAKIEGKTLNIELSNDKPDTTKEFEVRIGERSYSIGLPKIESDKLLQVRVDETTFRTEIKSSLGKNELTRSERVLSTRPKTAVSNKHALVEGAVTAPMTGKIVSIRAKKGEQVKAGQVLCIIEAMKMENEITTPKAGTVKEATVSEGSPVSEGETLFIIG